MPGAVPRTSTYALTNVTLPYLMRLVDLGVAGAVAKDVGFAPGVNVIDGKVTNTGVAQAHGLDEVPLAEVLH